ncbi:MAG: short-chain dehydrogenase/reductase [Frankiales bacterium]|nr:short-chain dehydrogenase/reductase [Frankiales bacterium]MCW2707388.1 short-chain dehydrogenase/reductase [Frankiales bacterium]
MMSSLGQPQSVLLLGGSSEIGLAIVDRYLAAGALRVVLAGRPSDRLTAAAERLATAGATVEVLPFDATELRSHGELVTRAFAGGDIDVAVLAFGVLGDQATAERELALAMEVVQTNYAAAVSVGLLVSQAMRAQGHGALVVLSSVAGERPRRSNFLYGSTKAGLDAFATGLGDSLLGSGVHVLVVRPGFVRGRMTEHLEPAPLSTTPEAVAVAVLAALRSQKQTVWVPGSLRFVMSALRHLPRPLFRRLPL